MAAIFLLLLLSLPIQANQAAPADEPLITISAKNTPIEECLREISRQAGVRFVYGNEIIKGIRITCSIKKTALSAGLLKILEGKGIGFKYTSPAQITLFEDKTLKKGKRIKGIVIDAKTGERLPYTAVYFEGTGTAATANSSGEFSAGELPPGQYQVCFRRIGYNAAVIQLNTDTLPSEGMSVSLSECAIMFEPVIITGENSDIFRLSGMAGQFSMSPQNNMIMPGIGASDISRSLHSVPGISAPEFGSSGLNIRGGIPSQNLILLDGISLYHMSHSFGFFNSVNSAAIKDVQVYKGGYPAKFGGRLSGVIEMTAKNGDFNSPHIDAGISQMCAQALAELPLFGKGAVLFSARRSISGYILNTLYEKVYYAFRENFSSFEPRSQAYSDLDSRIYFYDLLGKITLLPSDRDMITVSAFSGYDMFENQRKQTAEKAQLNENAKTDNYGYAAKWHRQWNGGFYSTLLVSGSNYSTENKKWWKNKIITDTIIVNNVNTYNYLKDLSASFDNTLIFQEGNELCFGAAYTEISTDFNFGLDYLPYYPEKSKRELKNDKVNLFSVYAQDKFRIIDKTDITAGLRVNRYKANNHPDFEPRLSLSFPLSPSVTLKASAGKYYQYIMQYEDFANVLQGRVSWISADNKEVKPSSAWHYIAGAKYEKEDYSIDAEFYYKNMSDVPETLYEWRLREKIPQNPQVIQNSARVKGFDLLLKKNGETFFGWIGYSYCSSECDYIINGEAKTAPSSNDAPHKFDLVANLKLGSFIFSAAWHFISGRPYSKPKLEAMDTGYDKLYYISEPAEYNNNRYPSSHQLDLSVMYVYSGKLVSGECGISVFNVYDRKNVWFGTTVLKDKELFLKEAHMLGVTPTFFMDIQL
jgi:outer membrane receptor protein involved in Fe transport